MRTRLILSVGTAILLLSGASRAFPETKSGEAKLPELSFQDVAKNAVNVSLGDKVKADCSHYINPDVFGKKVIFGNVIALPSDQLKKIVSYQVTVLEDEKEFGK
jgi:hypothetical protein